MRDFGREEAVAASEAEGTVVELTEAVVEGPGFPDREVIAVLESAVDNEEGKEEWREEIGKVVRSTVAGITGAGVSMGIGRIAFGCVEAAVVVKVEVEVRLDDTGVVVGLSIVGSGERSADEGSVKGEVARREEERGGGNVGEYGDSGEVEVDSNEGREEEKDGEKDSESVSGAEGRSVSDRGLRGCEEERGRSVEGARAVLGEEEEVCGEPQPKPEIDFAVGIKGHSGAAAMFGRAIMDKSLWGMVAGTDTVGQ